MYTVHATDEYGDKQDAWEEEFVELLRPYLVQYFGDSQKHFSEATSAVAFLTVHWSVWSALQPELHLLAVGSSSKEPASATVTSGETTMFTLSGVRSGVLWCKAALSVVN